MNFHTKTIRLSLIALFVFASSLPADAHFPWLALDADHKPILFFGEDVTDRTYHLPESMEAFSVQHVTAAGDATPIDLHPTTTDQLVGLQSKTSIDSAGCLFGSQLYGVYHGSKLVYFAEHLIGLDSNDWTVPPHSQDLRAAVTPHQDGIRVAVAWKDQPLPNQNVRLFSKNGQEEGAAETNAKGVVTFSGEQLKAGLNALVVGYTDKSASGTLHGQDYEATMNYLTVTFGWLDHQAGTNAVTSTSSASTQNSTERSNAVTVRASEFADLPFELTSFGGAVVGDTLYVYGGHTGAAHSYSTAEQSNEFLALDLRGEGDWSKLPSGPRLQGLAMVPYHNTVVRVGGFTAMNAKGDEHDLHSQATVSLFDIDANQWQDATPLPEPRSSHAAAVMGDQLFVIGGWSLSSDNGNHWHDTAWSADLSQPSIEWQPLATPPFRRRALSVAAHQGKIYAVGGMEKEGGPTTNVDIYDPSIGQWTRGPSLIGQPMTGFGCSAQSLGGSLYVSTVTGTVQRLSDDGAQWVVVGSYEPGRFFHCMLPIDEYSMVMVGGANMSVGRFTDLRMVELRARP